MTNEFDNILTALDINLVMECRDCSWVKKIPLSELGDVGDISGREAAAHIAFAHPDMLMLIAKKMGFPG